MLQAILFFLTISEIVAIRLCGRQLANALDDMCRGRGFHWLPRNERVPYLNRTDALQYLGSTTSSGPATECCLKSCSYQEMESYCAAGVSGSYARFGEMAFNLRTASLTSTTTTPTPNSPSSTRQPRPRQRFFGIFSRAFVVVPVQKLGAGITRTPVASHFGWHHS